MVETGLNVRVERSYVSMLELFGTSEAEPKDKSFVIIDLLSVKSLFNLLLHSCYFYVIIFMLEIVHFFAVVLWYLKKY